MTSVKSQSSSCYKGKQVISDPPAARDVGEEAVYFESDHSDEEEMERDWTVSVLHLLIPGTTFIPISQRFSAIMCRRSRAVYGSLFAGEIQTLPRLRWSLQFLI